MKRIIIDERNGWEYALKGDRYYPTGRVKRNGVMTPDEIPEDNEPEEVTIGKFGQRHLQYIRENKKGLYRKLCLAGNLDAYLYGIDLNAEALFSRLVKELAEKENVTEQLKADDQMLWVARMNNIRNRAEEIVNSEFVYV